MALAKLQAERAAALSVQEKLASLELEVDRVQDEIALAESTGVLLSRQLASLEALLLDGWGNPCGVREFWWPQLS